jgi:hypothetical protein
MSQLDAAPVSVHTRRPQLQRPPLLRPQGRGHFDATTAWSHAHRTTGLPRGGRPPIRVRSPADAAYCAPNPPTGLNPLGSAKGSLTRPDRSEARTSAASSPAARPIRSGKVEPSADPQSADAA